ncbi:hypothetical protein SNOG_16030 [Parastagonospora nodorum SN15]|uniref:Uncharacterized protein n=1 Tax=Phaeosphaeria nodorum (strain SN15 / ATCC MYA-4574 / FGSC 10173) TaxID=321614 RepID=Q0TWV9_PHANO|nr:hypothetical protein SNOG_16030 [Parastagonospora nodorum SN15]EAT76609.1 hypothetical protein SNOG_16030 [Parastagonospora nodorum SN15]
MSSSVTIRLSIVLVLIASPVMDDPTIFRLTNWIKSTSKTS